MIITTTVYLTADGGIRLAGRSDSRPKKGELAATLVLDVPDSAFQPPSLTLRATVSAAKPEPILPAVRAGNGHRANADTGSAAEADSPWTGARIRRVQSLTGLDDETFARRLNVSLPILTAWKTAAKPVKLAAADMNRLEALEAETKGVMA